jgi:site-specific DNA-adenine methylase
MERGFFIGEENELAVLVWRVFGRDNYRVLDCGGYSMSKKLKTRSALPWFGSDAAVSKSLAGFIEGCPHTTILCAGGLSILPYIKSRAVLVNDKHEDAIHYYRVAAGRYGENAAEALFDECENTLAHPAELTLARTMLVESEDPVERAWAFWVECWLGRKGQGGTKKQGTGRGSIRYTAGGGTNATRISTAAAEQRDWASLMKRCEFESEDFRDLAERLKPKTGDKPNGLYVDPPWFGAGKSYRHAFSDQDHRDLERITKDLAGRGMKVVIRYDDDSRAHDLYSSEDWDVYTAETRNQANLPTGEAWFVSKLKKD